MRYYWMSSDSAWKKTKILLTCMHSILTPDERGGWLQTAKKRMWWCILVLEFILLSCANYEATHEHLDPPTQRQIQSNEYAISSFSN